MTDLELQGMDMSLVQATLKGDRDSYTRLIENYQHVVFGLCRGMLGNRDDALDAAQDTFLSAYQSLSSLRSQSDFRAWLRGIATNVCRAKLRSRRPHVDYDADSFTPFEAVDRDIDLDQALEGLGEDLRTAVLLFYFEDSSVREIAQFLGVSETTVMSRLRNARSQLRQATQFMFEQPRNQSSLPEDFASKVPIPYDEYGPNPKANLYNPLDPWRRKWLLSHFPSGATIQDSKVLGYDWEDLPERAVLVTVATPGQDSVEVLLRTSGRKDGIKIEAALLPLLQKLGVGVPALIAEPVIEPGREDRGMLIATTPPLGKSALGWAVDGGTIAIDRACEVVMEGIEVLKSLTHQIPDDLPLERATLRQELERVAQIGGPWLSHDRFSKAVAKLEPIVAGINDPLVFSDSGLGPNARVDDDGNLVGFETLAWARIEDPHYGVTKYWTYDCWPIRRAGFVERYLVSQGLTMHDFAPRLAIRALVTLQREIALEGGDDGYRNDMLGWLELAMRHLDQ